MKWPDRGVTRRAKNAQTPLPSKANAMIKIKRPPNVPQVSSIPSEVPETLHALKHSSTFAKIREQVSRFRFPEAAKKAIIGWRHKNIEEPETPPATPAALKEKTTATGRKPLEIQHFDEAYAALQEARKTDPSLVGGCSRAVDLIVAHLKNAGAPINKGRRRTVKRRIQELDKARS